MVDIDQLAPALLPAPVAARRSNRKVSSVRGTEGSIKPYTLSTEWHNVYSTSQTGAPFNFPAPQGPQMINDFLNELVQIGHLPRDTLFHGEPIDLRMLDNSVFFSTESPSSGSAVPELCYSSSASSSPSPTPSICNAQLTTTAHDAFIFNTLGLDLNLTAPTPFSQFNTPESLIFQAKQNTFW
ncbi:hypothetical protein BDQ17DRAFT_293077 [Cyathus striatus]|nr:hypothetical protein BDQ17DRAFT_293077 [Cyathus striatus]